MTNQYPGLARGPIDHNASSVINVIANDEIDMGSSVLLNTTIPAAEILPRVDETTAAGNFVYGIVVGGDTDGIYGDGSEALDDSTKAASSAGEAVVVVTQGRCLARVKGENSNGDATISIGQTLGPSNDEGVLRASTAAGVEFIIARALQPVASGETDIIAVDIQREGVNQ